MKNHVGIKCTVLEVEKIFTLLIRDIVVVIDVAVAVVAVVVVILLLPLLTTPPSLFPLDFKASLESFLSWT